MTLLVLALIRRYPNPFRITGTEYAKYAEKQYALTFRFNPTKIQLHLQPTDRRN